MALRCEYCGKEVPGPERICNDLHPSPSQDRNPKMSEIPENVMKRACEWIVGRDTGLSSKALWAVMMGVKSDGSYPSDGSDLGRCLRLLEAVPEWEARLPEMASISPYWKALVEHWPELKAMHSKAAKTHSDGGLYERMKAILDPIEDRDPNVVRMGGGVTMRFGR